MADSEVVCFPCSEFSDKCTLPETVEECRNCLKLHTKCSKALEEINSLNLAIKLLVEEMKATNLDTQKISESGTRSNSTRKINVEVSDLIRDEWSEVSPRRSTPSSGNIRINQMPNCNTILTSNRYGPLTNLTDSHDRAYDTLERRKQAVNHVRPTKKAKHIPTIVNGVAHAAKPNKSGKYGNEGPNMNNSLKSGVPSVLILSDSHLKGCIVKVNDHLATTFRTSGWVKPGAPADEILKAAKLEVINLNKHDVIVLCVGANDVYRNNSIVAYRSIIKFVMRNNNTNIIIMEVPHRHDLSDRSCVNTAIQSFNNKLKNIAAKYEHVTITESPQERRYYTLHGLHFNRRGKIQIAKQVITEINKTAGKKVPDPIQLGWLFESVREGPTNNILTIEIQRDNEGARMEPQVTVDTGTESRRSHETSHPTPQIVTSEVTSETIPGVTNISNQGLRTSNRVKRIPNTRRDDFLWA
jgi:hypothetical protein